MLILLILFPVAYLAGSINFAIFLFKILNKEDPRSGFSGNAGTTNVYRQAGMFWAVVVLLLDVGRALGVAALSMYLLQPELAPLAGFGLILGNRFPCFHQFSGGKGVANYLGFTAMITPASAGLSAIIWVIMYGIARAPFIASFFMIFTLAAGTVVTFNYHPMAFTGSAITALFIYYNHKLNIIEYIKKFKDDK